MAVSSFQAAVRGCHVTDQAKVLPLRPCRAAGSSVIRLTKLPLWANGHNSRLALSSPPKLGGNGSGTAGREVCGCASTKKCSSTFLSRPIFDSSYGFECLCERGICREDGNRCLRRTSDMSSPRLRRGRRSVGLAVAQATPAASTSAAAAADTASPPAPSGSLGLEVVELEEPNSRVRLHITVPAAVCAEAYDEVLKELKKRTRVPGFRKGYVPDMLLVNFVGPRVISASAVESVLKRTLPEAMSSVAGRSLKDSEHIVTKIDDLHNEYDRLKPLSYEVVVDVLPKVSWILEDAYKFLSVEVEVDGPEAVQAAADAELRSRQKDLGTLRIAPDRALAVGDVAILDVSARRLAEDGTPGEKILSVDQKGFQLDTSEAEVLPGFLDAVKGLRRGETREFNLTFPAKWEPSVLQGVKALFTVDLKELFYREVPELDNAIASKIVEGCTTIDEVRSSLLSKYQKNAEDAKKRAAQEAVADELGRVCVAEIPHSLLEEQGRQMYAAKLLEMQATGRLSKEQVTQLSAAEMVQNFLVAQKAQISEAVKKSFAVSEVFSREGLAVTDEELNAEVEGAVADFKRYNQEYDEQRIREQAQEVLEGTKVLNWLVEHANIKYIERKQ
ncbi:hypothetical protein CBR_g21850 [Chara braunii]|uniref:peptidylprolyl isomerase n=1 Tax=Chara braunii TaxID=69332 RepID=A0A388JUR8_CHABU|nr:hypothetical protein CBR_g21850 [Chara braunii]|eukprot:GBG61507.1 hypothetical protein CBR_g21850 [Chara braunii]